MTAFKVRVVDLLSAVLITVTSVSCAVRKAPIKPKLLLSDKFDVSQLLYPVDKDSVNDQLRAAGFHTEFGSVTVTGPKGERLEFGAINLPQNSMLGFEGTFSVAYVSHWVQFYYFVAGRLSESDKDSLLARVDRMYHGYGRAEGREGDNSEIYGHINIDSSSTGISCENDTLRLTIQFPNVEERIR